MYALVFWGLVSVLYIAGEPVDECMPLGRFCLLKAAGMVSFGMCACVWLRLQRAGMLPVLDDDGKK